MSQRSVANSPRGHNGRFCRWAMRRTCAGQWRAERIDGAAWMS